MSFGIQIIGFLILIGGMIYAAVLLHIATHWIAVGAICSLGSCDSDGGQSHATKRSVAIGYSCLGQTGPGTS